MATQYTKLYDEEGEPMLEDEVYYLHRLQYNRMKMNQKYLTQQQRELLQRQNDILTNHILYKTKLPSIDQFNSNLQNEGLNSLAITSSKTKQLNDLNKQLQQQQQQLKKQQSLINNSQPSLDQNNNNNINNNSNSNNSNSNNNNNDMASRKNDHNDDCNKHSSWEARLTMAMNATKECLKSMPLWLLPKAFGLNFNHQTSNWGCFQYPIGGDHTKMDYIYDSELVRCHF